MLAPMMDARNASLVLDRPGAADASETGTHLDDLATPALVLDRDRMEANIARMRRQLAAHGVPLRPHLKTAKSIEVARALLGSNRGPATVSTLREAEQFASAGITDMIYAVGISADKLERAVALRRRGVDLALLLDSVEQVQLVAEKSRAAGVALPCWIEIDCDDHRGGLKSDDPEILAVARALDRQGVPLCGVLTHAGEAYNGTGGAEDLAAAAEQERRAAIAAAGMIRDAGLPCPGVSIGSTPTALFGQNFEGVSEVRAGVYVFFDLVMAGLGVCRPEDIAVSVLASVIGRRRDGKAIIDAGWMALSRDLGRSLRDGAPHYGAVCDLDGRALPGLAVVGVNQEHGIVGTIGAAGGPVPLEIGERVRILPNHACATSAQHERYHVVAGSRAVEAEWPRFNGW
ncbi:MAG: alanine racemase [Xanthobacteraceae bacterium]|jgi:D-serine deaminase-like pyridoxal phosphate-dependent protein|nr:alanine racemase [Xanthobacteraceae bacterium]